MPASTPVFEIYHGDCVEGMQKLEAESVDAVVTSPPYNLGIQYSQYKDDVNRAEFLDWSVRWGSEVRRVLKPDGALFLNVGSAPANPLFPHEIAIRFSSLFILQNTIHWIKSITVETRAGETISAGHFKPINSPRYLTDCHEYLFHFTKSGYVPVHRLGVGVPYADKSNIARWGHTEGRDLRCRGNNWFVPYKTILKRAKDRPHPATYPVALAAMCLRLHGIDPANENGNRQGVVLDPFLGIGHTALAAKECGAARMIGFDIDAEYLAEARSRLSDLAVSNTSEMDFKETIPAAFPAVPSSAEAESPLFPMVDVAEKPPGAATKKRGRPKKTI